MKQLTRDLRQGGAGRVDVHPSQQGADTQPTYCPHLCWPQIGITTTGQLLAVLADLVLLACHVGGAWLT